MSRTLFNTVPSVSRAFQWLAAGTFAACLSGMSARADEKASSANTRRTPMVGMEAQFVRAKAEQMRAAFADAGKFDAGEFKPGAGAPIVVSADHVKKALAALKASNADFFCNPQTITKSGQKAVVEAVRELRYPTQFEPSKSEPGKVVLGSFETRDVGVKMEFQPVVAPDGMISVTLEPSIVTFEGFIDYSNGKPGLNSAEPRALEELLKAPLKEGGIWQPIFSTQKLSTGVEMSSGQTLVLEIGSPSADPAPERSMIPKDDRRRELNTYIFVTTRVIAPE